MFLNDLGGYPADAVELALASWRQDSSVFPTPHDILKILRFDLDESVPDPRGFQGWFVKRAVLLPGDEGYIKPPALGGEIRKALKRFAAAALLENRRPE